MHTLDAKVTQVYSSQHIFHERSLDIQYMFNIVGLLLDSINA